MADELSVSLKEYVDDKFLALEKSLTLARTDMDRRLEGMNEFRDQLNRQAATFVTRDTCSISSEKREADIRMLRESRATLEGKASQQSVYVTLALSFLSLLFGAISLVLHWIK